LWQALLKQIFLELEKKVIHKTAKLLRSIRSQKKLKKKKSLQWLVIFCHLQIFVPLSSLFVFFPLISN